MVQQALTKRGVAVWGVVGVVKEEVVLEVEVAKETTEVVAGV